MKDDVASKYFCRYIWKFENDIQTRKMEFRSFFRKEGVLKNHIISNDFLLLFTSAFIWGSVLQFEGFCKSINYCQTFQTFVRVLFVLFLFQYIVLVDVEWGIFFFNCWLISTSAVINIFLSLRLIYFRKLWHCPSTSFSVGGDVLLWTWCYVMRTK